jgi:hypothetical protein
MINGNIKTKNDTVVRNKAGFVMKRFLLSPTANKKVFDYLRLVSAQWIRDGKKGEPVWEDALEELIATHPKLKNI